MQEEIQRLVKYIEKNIMPNQLKYSLYIIGIVIAVIIFGMWVGSNG